MGAVEDDELDKIIVLCRGQSTSLMSHMVTFCWAVSQPALFTMNVFRNELTHNDIIPDQHQLLLALRYFPRWAVMISLDERMTVHLGEEAAGSFKPTDHWQPTRPKSNLDIKSGNILLIS